MSNDRWLLHPSFLFFSRPKPHESKMVDYWEVSVSQESWPNNEKTFGRRGSTVHLEWWLISQGNSWIHDKMTLVFCIYQLTRGFFIGLLSCFFFCTQGKTYANCLSLRAFKRFCSFLETQGFTRPYKRASCDSFYLGSLTIVWEGFVFSSTDMFSSSHTSTRVEMVATLATTLALWPPKENPHVCRHLEGGREDQRWVEEGDTLQLCGLQLRCFQ